MRREAFFEKTIGGHVRLLASPCCYRHGSKDLNCSVHGDDFVIAGGETDLELARPQLEKCFIVKVFGCPGSEK